MFNIVQLAPRPEQKCSERICFPSGAYSGLKALLIIILVSLPLARAFSQPTGGGHAEPYLLRDIGGRPGAMAGTFTAIANDPSCIFYNPAGLGFFSAKPLISGSMAMLGMDRTTGSLAWGQLVSENVGVGFGMASLYSGSFTARNSQGAPIGTLSNFQYAMSAAASYSIEFASMGVAVKYLTNNLIGSPTEATGFGVDVGAKFNIMDMFSFGIAVQNISGYMFWNNLNKSMEALPYSIRTGVAMEFGINPQEYESRSTVTGELETVYVPPTRYVLVGLDAIVSQYDKSPTFTLGIEAAVHEMIAFRGGIALYGDDRGTPKLLPMTKWGGGLSLRPKIEQIIDGIPFKTHLDYSVSNDFINESGITHTISLLFEF